MNTLANLAKRSSFFWVTIGLISVVFVGIADVETGSEFAFSLFYLIPIVLVTQLAGKNSGLFVSVISAITWFIADVLTGQSYSQPIIRYWNAGVRLVFFVVVIQLLRALKELDREKEMARIDYLTNIPNRRSFFEVAQRELDRSQRYRHPFTIVYIDLDGFKTVNDQWGHKAGDKLLCVVVDQTKKHLRETDTIARLGGDEFVLLFPETDQAAAQVIISRVQHALLDEMKRKSWPVTFSIGVLTCQEAQITVDELVKKADELMYSVKNNGKNAVAYGVCPNRLDSK
jgi:diguanylate cyclase (GGDEF)-like protein